MYAGVAVVWSDMSVPCDAESKFCVRSGSGSGSGSTSATSIEVTSFSTAVSILNTQSSGTVPYDIVRIPLFTVRYLPGSETLSNEMPVSSPFIASEVLKVIFALCSPS